MRALIMRDKQLRVDEYPTCTPGPGEVLIRVNACGICGSDLHALKHGKEFVAQLNKGGTLGLNMNVDEDVVEALLVEAVVHLSDCEDAMTSAHRGADGLARLVDGAIFNFNIMMLVGPGGLLVEAPCLEDALIEEYDVVLLSKDPSQLQVKFNYLCAVLLKAQLLASWSVPDLELLLL